MMKKFICVTSKDVRLHNIFFKWVEGVCLQVVNPVARELVLPQLAEWVKEHISRTNRALIKKCKSLSP